MREGVRIADLSPDSIHVPGQVLVPVELFQLERCESLLFVCCVNRPDDTLMKISSM